MEQSITIKNLCKSYGQTQILKDISFEAKAGRVTAFLGPKWSWKKFNLTYFIRIRQSNIWSY